MNFYKRFMGDYAKDTAHLSLAEHGAYTLLLDHYYATESPLPEDYQALYRICRAFDKKERQAVCAVADAFFPVIDGGRVNARAMRQMDEDANRVETARVNGKRGGRPKKLTQEEPNENPVGFYLETQEEPKKNPAKTQEEPNTKAHHSHSQNKEKKHSSTGVDHADLRFPEFWELWPKTARKVAKAECAKKWRLHGLDSHADAILRHVAAMKSTRQWSEGYEPAPLTYLNQRRWEDDSTTSGVDPSDPNYAMEAAI